MLQRNKWFAAGGVAAGALAALALAIPALAQDNPESILPPGFGEPAAPRPAPQPGPQPVSPRGPAESSQVVEASPSSLTASELAAAVQVEIAPPVEMPADARRDPFTVGALPASVSGIGEAPWGASSGRFLSGLMRTTQAPLASRWGQIMLRNVLLTRTRAPGLVHPADWVGERAWMLLRMGEADAARMLVSGVDVADFSPKLAQVAAQSALANADPSALCPIRDELPKSERKIMPMVRAICASLSGNSAVAAADIEAARRRGGVSTIDLVLADKVVGAGAEAARAVNVEWKDVDHLNAWRFGMATATGIVPPKALMDKAPARLRAYQARSPILSAEQRLASARIAAGLGVFSSQALLDLYAQVFDATDSSDLGSTDAWKLRQAFVGKDRDAKIAAIKALLGDGTDKIQQEAGRALVARAAMLIQPDKELQDIAPQLIASMLTAGYDRQAARWAEAVAQMDDKPRADCWALLALSAPTITIDTDDIDDFIDEDTSAGKKRSALLVAGLAGLGRIDAETANSYNGANAMGLGRKTSWSAAIDKASMLRQPGTVMLLAAMGLQGQPGGTISPMHLYHLTTALRRNGMEFAARMIAAEAVARS